MSTVETAHKAHVLLRLAEFVRTDLADKPYAAGLMAATAAVVVDRPVAPYWFALLDDLKRRDHVEDTVAYPNRAAELGFFRTKIAATLWALIYGGRRYCQRCIDSLPGEPHEVAAKAGGRDTCERHMARTS